MTVDDMPASQDTSSGAPQAASLLIMAAAAGLRIRPAGNREKS
jgi:hypothetical protein